MKTNDISVNIENAASKEVGRDSAWDEKRGSITPSLSINQNKRKVICRVVDLTQPEEV